VRPVRVAPGMTTLSQAFERPVGGGEMVWTPLGWQVDGGGEALAVGADPAVAVEDEDASFAPGRAGSPGAFLAGGLAAEGAAGAAVAEGGFARLLRVGAPRFELGTSSPPDYWSSRTSS
jgi:hypothetical protein